MTTLADNVLALQTQVTALQTAVTALTTTGAVTNAELTAALAPLQTTLNDVDAQLKPTPAASTPAA